MDTTLSKFDQLLNLQSLPIFSHCSTHQLVRLLPYIEERDIANGDFLYQADTPASNLYFLLKGQIFLTAASGRNLQEITEGFCGEEAAVGANNYLGNARACGPCTVWVIPSKELRANIGKNVSVVREFYNSLFSHYSDEKKLYLPKEVVAAAVDMDRVSTWEIIGWILAVVLPIVTWYVCGREGVEIKARLFLVVFTSITVMWVGRLVNEFIPCILGVLALLILGVAPPLDILQGFSSGEFFMAMSIFGVGAVLVTSGLTFRIVLLLLKYIPATPISHCLAMTLFGIGMTPVLPSANGRIGLVGPIMVDMLGSLEYAAKGAAATAIASATFLGFTLYASIFLTSKPINFVVYGLLPSQVQDQFQFGGWFHATLVSAIVMFALTVLFLMIFAKSDEKPKLSLHHINAQLKLLGPLSAMEWTALVSVIVFIFGTAFSSMHKIEPPWVALAVLTLLLAVDALQRKEFHEKVDWSFILYLAGLIGLVKTMSSVGVDAMIARQLEFAGPLMRSNFGLFVLALFLSMGVVRLIVPNNATIAMYCTILLPIAQANGINPWVIGYIILTFSDGWIFPFQCTYYLLFLELTEKSGHYDAKKLLRFQMLSNLFRIAAIYASIPYWKWLGII